MGRREDLCRAEEVAWKELSSVLRSLPPGHFEEPGINPEGWTVKDLLWHLACWHAECAHALERIRLGTYQGWDEDTDELNRLFLEESRRLDLGTVRTTLAAAHTRMLQELAAFSEAPAEAVEWFEESGPSHCLEHLSELRAWAERFAPGA